MKLGKILNGDDTRDFLCQNFVVFNVCLNSNNGFSCGTEAAQSVRFNSPRFPLAAGDFISPSTPRVLPFPQRISFCGRASLCGFLKDMLLGHYVFSRGDPDIFTHDSSLLPCHSRCI